MQNAIRRLIPIILTTSLLAGCATMGSDTPLADGSSVALGQRANVDGPIIQPVKILEDSRCPMNARCIWAGRVRLKMLWLRPTGEKQVFELITGQPAPLADGTIQLENVTPASMAGAKAIEPSDYRFAFRFDGGI